MSSASAMKDAMSQLKSAQVYDYMRVQRDDALKSFLESQAKESGAPVEKLLFSAEVVKINRKEKHQRRALILTDAALYNFSFSFFGSVFSNLKRRIAHTDLGGIVLSRTSDECVVRVVNDYDYRYIIERRSEVVEVLSKCYQALSGGKPLAVAFSQETDLGCETKTKDSMCSAAAASSSGAAALADAVDAVEIEEEPPCSEGFRHRGVIREGWLAKKKGLHEKWELKYFVLTCDRLSYHSVQVQGVYDIDSEKVFAHSKSDDAKAPSPSNADASHSSETSSDSCNSNSSSNARSASSSNSSGEAGFSASGAFASTKSAESRRASVRRMSTIGGSSADLFDHYLTLVLGDRSSLDLAADSALVLANWTHELKNKGELQGWLMMKLGRATKAWRRVFLYLRGSRMWFYAMEPKGAIELIDGAGCNLARLVQNTLPPAGAGVGTTVPARSRFAHRLNVSECDRIFNLAADSAHSAAQWMAAIETAARQHTVGGLIDGSATAAANASASAEAAAMANVPAEMRSTVAQMAPEGQVTFVFTDVQNSTNLWEAAPDEMNDALEIHDAVMRDLLVVYRGYEVKTEGDAFMVTFFTPLDALLWCMAVQRALLRSDWPKALLAQPAATSVADAQTGAPSFAGIRVRMGVHSGFPNCRRNPVTGRMDYFGPVVNRSARISDTAHGGQIVCSRDVHDALVAAQQQPAESLDARLGDFRPAVVDHGQYPLKGIKDLTSIIQVSSHELASRVFPPLRATKQ